eukprot:Ihof_evm5s223 gene=Ihof_evmTU5s223
MSAPYIPVVGMVIGAHLLMPTWAAAKGDEPPALGCVNLTITPKELRENFIYSQKNVQKGNWWTALSYMFLHQDESHLVRNMFGLFIMGHSVFEAFGAVSFLAIYFGGGIAGALDKWTKSHQMKIVLEEVCSVPDDLGPFTDWWNNGVKKMAHHIAPRINPHFCYVGASAGVFALTGANLCISLETLARHLYRRPDQIQIGGTNIPPSVHTAITLFNVYVLSKELTTELNYLAGGLSWQ